MAGREEKSWINLPYRFGKTFPRTSSEMKPFEYVIPRTIHPSLSSINHSPRNQSKINQSLKMETTLNPKQQLFCEEYLFDLNATAAARRAGYSLSTAESGYLLTIPAVQDYLSARQREKIDKYHISLDLVLTEMANIAFCKVEDCFYTSGELKPFEFMELSTRAAVASVDVKRKYSPLAPTQKIAEQVKVRMHNKLRALDLLAKHLTIREAKERDEAEKQAQVDIMAKYASDEDWEEEAGSESGLTEFKNFQNAAEAEEYPSGNQNLQDLANFQNFGETGEYPSGSCLNQNLQDLLNFQNLGEAEEYPRGNCLNQNLQDLLNFQNLGEAEEYPRGNENLQDLTDFQNLGEAEEYPSGNLKSPPSGGDLEGAIETPMYTQDL